MLTKWFSKNPVLAEYRRYRATAKDLNHKIIEKMMTEPVLDKAARALGLGRNKLLILDSEDEMNVLMDFALYEISDQGQNLVQRYQGQQPAPENAIKQALLTAMAQASIGLFKIESVSKQTYQLELQELAGETRQLSLIDINFSQSPAQGLIVVFRPIVLAQFTMTSGMAFIFPPSMQPQLVKQWRRGGSAERYVRCFKLSKNKGIPMEHV